MAKLRINLANPAGEYMLLKQQIDEAVAKVLSKGNFILGDEVELFEQEAASYLNVQSTVGVSSGTDALIMALMALGVNRESEIITTSFSFIATSSAIVRVGAKPVFVDLEEDGFNMDPAKVRAAITEKTAAIIVVHLFGQCAAMDEILKIAREHEIEVIEDAAQAFGASYGSSKAGTMGNFGCYSFFPAKPLGCAGDGGLILSTSEEKTKMLRMLRMQGASSKNVHPIVGGNFRLDTIQAAILRVKLPMIEQWIEIRRKYANLYIQKLRPLEGKVKLPIEKEGTSCTWAQFSILAHQRDKLRDFLRERGIGSEVYYPVPLPHQDSMRTASGKNAADKFQNAERVAREVLSIPVHHLLLPDEIEEVAYTIIEFYEKHDS